MNKVRFITIRVGVRDLEGTEYGHSEITIHSDKGVPFDDVTSYCINAIGTVAQQALDDLESTLAEKGLETNERK